MAHGVYLVYLMDSAHRCVPPSLSPSGPMPVRVLLSVYAFLEIRQKRELVWLLFFISHFGREIVDLFNLSIFPSFSDSIFAKKSFLYLNFHCHSFLHRVVFLFGCCAIYLIFNQIQNYIVNVGMLTKLLNLRWGCQLLDKLCT